MSIKRKVPLSFQGNKSKHIDHFINYITDCPATTFIDLFGGSCYLSYVVHQLKPQAKVICNDFDNYRERLINVETTNQIIDSIRSITTTKKETKYTPEETQQIKDIIKGFQSNNSFIDSVTLSRCLCFSGNYCSTIDELLKQTIYYNSLPKNHYETQWYLDALQGIEFVRKDWYELFNQYKDDDMVCFIADPPYLGTDKSPYSSKFWGLGDSMDTVLILKHKFFVYYTSEKSEIIPLIEFLNREFLTTEPITFQTLTIQRSGLNRSAKSWQDIMLVNL